MRQQIHEGMGNKEGVIDQQKVVLTVNFKVKDNKITLFSISSTSFTTTLQRWEKALAAYVVGKRVAELSRLTDAFIQKIVHSTAAEQPLNELLACTITEACAEYAKQHAHALLEESMHLLNEYEEGFPRRTIEDIGLEYGDCGCARKEHEHVE